MSSHTHSDVSEIQLTCKKLTRIFRFIYLVDQPCPITSHDDRLGAAVQYDITHMPVRMKLAARLGKNFSLDRNFAPVVGFAKSCRCRM